MYVKVTFYKTYEIDDKLLKFAVIAARYEDKWILCRHKERDTYEIPGGHREQGEDIAETARCELYEETGATVFKIIPVCVYGVTREAETSYGMLFTAEVTELGELPAEFEMRELIFCHELPAKLTYPQIQPSLFRRVSRCFPKMQPIDASIRAIVTTFIIKEWGSAEMYIRGEVIDLHSIDGFVILGDNQNDIEGLITYTVSGNNCEIVSLNSTNPRNGIGTALVDMVRKTAIAMGCNKLQLLTTNDNLNAIGFYQKHGFELIGVNLGAIDEERRSKPEIPLVGQNGIPIHHEIAFEMTL